MTVTRDFHIIGQQEFSIWLLKLSPPMNTRKLASQEIIETIIRLSIYTSADIIVFIFVEHSLLWTWLVFGSSPSQDLIPKTGSGFDRHMQYYRQTQNNIVKVWLWTSFVCDVETFGILLKVSARKHLWDSAADNVKCLVNLCSPRKALRGLHSVLTVKSKHASLFQLGKPVCCPSWCSAKKWWWVPRQMNRGQDNPVPPLLGHRSVSLCRSGSTVLPLALQGKFYRFVFSSSAERHLQWRTLMSSAGFCGFHTGMSTEHNVLVPGLFGESGVTGVSPSLF